MTLPGGKDKDMDIEKSISATDLERWEEKLIARESELHDWAGEIQEREKQVREDEKKARERAKVNRTDYLFEAINRDNHKLVLSSDLPPVVQVVQGRKEKAGDGLGELFAFAVALLAFTAFLVLAALK